MIFAAVSVDIRNALAHYFFSRWLTKLGEGGRWRWRFFRLRRRAALDEMTETRLFSTWMAVVFLGGFLQVVVVVVGQRADCLYLQMGQYLCDSPEIDPDTQQAKGCDKDTKTVKVPCRPAPEIFCGGTKHNGTTIGFYKDVSCKWTNGHSFEIALLLSIFLGMFGIDRFYLGYPAIGLLKFSTLGFMFLGQLVDILLIATQVLKPSDGSDYVIDYYGPGVDRIMMDNNTYIKPQEYV